MFMGTEKAENNVLWTNRLKSRERALRCGSSATVYFYYDSMMWTSKFREAAKRKSKRTKRKNKTRKSIIKIDWQRTKRTGKKVTGRIEDWTRFERVTVRTAAERSTPELPVHLFVGRWQNRSVFSFMTPFNDVGALAHLPLVGPLVYARRHSALD